MPTPRVPTPQMTIARRKWLALLYERGPQWPLGHGNAPGDCFALGWTEPFMEEGATQYKIPSRLKPHQSFRNQITEAGVAALKG